MKNIYRITILTLFLFGAVSTAYANEHYMKEEIMKCDENKDGMISRQEFMDSKEKKFKEADHNNDGKLSSSEIDMMIKEKKDKRD